MEGIAMVQKWKLHMNPRVRASLTKNSLVTVIDENHWLLIICLNKINQPLGDKLIGPDLFFPSEGYGLFYLGCLCFLVIGLPFLPIVPRPSPQSMSIQTFWFIDSALPQESHFSYRRYCKGHMTNDQIFLPHIT
jgi:hypothetical protein